MSDSLSLSLHFARTKLYTSAKFTHLQNSSHRALSAWRPSLFTPEAIDSLTGSHKPGPPHRQTCTGTKSPIHRFAVSCMHTSADGYTLIQTHARHFTRPAEVGEESYQLSTSRLKQAAVSPGDDKHTQPCHFSPAQAWKCK